MLVNLTLPASSTCELEVYFRSRSIREVFCFVPVELSFFEQIVWIFIV